MNCALIWNMVRMLSVHKKLAMIIERVKGTNVEVYRHIRREEILIAEPFASQL